MAIEYTGNSITDYLKSIGKDASYQARSVLAAEKGIQNYTGSAEQNTQLLSSLRSTQTTPQQTSTTPSLTNISQNTASQNQDLLAKAQAELSKRLQSNVTNVNQISNTPSLPTDATTTSYPSIDVTSANSVNDLITAEQLRLNEERQAAQNTLKSSGLGGTGTTLQEQLFTGYQTNVPTADYATALKTTQEEFGVVTGLSDYKLQSQKVATMKGAIESLDLQRQNELDTASNRQASMTSINAEKNAINERYDSQRVKLVGDYNIEAAVLSAQSGYLTEANKLVDDAVQAYTADITAEITRFNNLYTMASDWVGSLDAAEKSILDDAKAELEKKKEEETARLTGVGNLMVEYNKYGAGITMNDTIEQAVAKASKVKIPENPQLKYISDDSGNVRVYDESSGTPVLVSELGNVGTGNPQIAVAQIAAQSVYLANRGLDEKVSYQGYYDMYNEFVANGGGSLSKFYSLYPMTTYMDAGNQSAWKEYAKNNKIEKADTSGIGDTESLFD